VRRGWRFDYNAAIDETPVSAKQHIIVVEDDEGNRRTLTRALERDGYRVDAFSEADPALEYLRENRDVVLVITDLMLPGKDGFEVLEASRGIDPEVGLLMVTGHGSVESAVDAMKRGADDYLTKPVHLEELRERTSAIIEKRRLSRRVDELESRLGQLFKIVGQSKSMQDLFRQMELVAPARANVLIISESGTGKELVANALHENSPRSTKRFLPINCAAIPSEILESELFGHERGAFTGATARKRGKFELADGGTVFLDEIGELPLEMQAKLLRVLEQQDFMRVGGTETIRVDIRVIAATNSDLEAAVEDGKFRSDLYYRLKVVTMRIPPLRERREDIPLLLRHFLDIYRVENGRENLRFSTEVMGRLMQASLTVLAPHDEIRLEDLPIEYRGEPTADARPSTVAAAADAGPDAGLTMDEIERRAILGALEKTGGNRTRAAGMLGIGLRTLQRKLKEYRLAGKD
jgi:DNA-binding NtrC family response regulator